MIKTRSYYPAMFFILARWKFKVEFGWTHEGGWLSILASVFVRRVDVIGRGFSGYNTRMCKAVLPLLYPNKDSLKDCVFFTIFLGANDACLSQQQHVPIEEYKRNLQWMIKYLNQMELPVDHILLISLPPVDENKWGVTERAEGLPLTRKLVNYANYAIACEEVSKLNQVNHINLFEAMINQKDWESFLSDGLHFSRKGSEFLANILQAFFADKLSGLKWWFPDWKTINPITPEMSINGDHESKV
ncbi:unnamed protein product [Trichobilharzia szidati]|nr:unnamed protein product [Trichobilharzia szidati]